MRIEQLQYFHEIGKYRSLSKASEHLFITQPTLSRSLKALEDELGVELLLRTSSGIQLTNAALNLLPIIDEILAKINLLKQQANLQNISQLNFSEFTLNILTIPGIVDAYLINTLNKFYKSYPMCSIRVNITETKEFQKITKLSDNQLVITKLLPQINICSYLSFDNNEVTSKKICEEQQIAIMRRDSKLNNGNYILAEQSYAQKIVLNINGIDMISVARRVMNDTKLDLDILLQSNDISVIKSVILSQDAIYLTNTKLSQKYDFSENEFAILPIYITDTVPSIIDLYAFYNKTSPFTPWISSFLEMLAYGINHDE